MNYYERYVGDYQRDTAHLSLAEHGAYTMLLDTYYATESALPVDYMALYRICRAFDKAEQKAVRSIADQFFPVAQDGLRHNNKADLLIPKALKRISTASSNGKLGGRPIKTQAEPTGLILDNPLGLPIQTQPQSLPTPTRTKNIRRNSADEPEGFAEFWQAWPSTDRKTARAECVKRWKARGIESHAETVIADVLRRKDDDKQWRDGYEPAPLTYINQRRWEDAPADGGRKPWE